jgi:hypothetical protein
MVARGKRLRATPGNDRTESPSPGGATEFGNYRCSENISSRPFRARDCLLLSPEAATEDGLATGYHLTAPSARCRN